VRCFGTERRTIHFWLIWCKNIEKLKKTIEINQNLQKLLQKVYFYILKQSLQLDL